MDHTPVNLDAVSHRFIETNGLRIHIAEQGTGPLLLLQQERAEEVNAALLAFLQEQTIARG